MRYEDYKKHSFYLWCSLSNEELVEISGVDNVFRVARNKTLVCLDYDSNPVDTKAHVLGEVRMRE